MVLLLVLTFIVFPIAELYVIIKVGEQIGVLWTLALLVADSVLGSMLMRAQGRAVWRRFNAAVAKGRVPTREVLDGVLVVFGGAFLLTPGFITDIIGVLLLLPPTRAAFRGLLIRNMASRVVVGVAARGAGGATRRRQARRGPSAYDVEGSAVEVDTDRPDRDRLER
jgi:UPF0716 protein FxsA